MSHQQNIIRIKAIYNALAHLKNEVIFVGGATVSLYADREAPEVRETDDVGILVELFTYKEFSDLEEQLRSIGFVNDNTAKFVGRFITHGFIVDVMPTAENILGFSNRWYAEGFKKAIDFSIDEQHTVKIFSAPYFLATKLEAFKSRGKNKITGNYDGRTSTDFEDIIFVLENRSIIWEEINITDPELKRYLIEEFSRLLKNPYIEEWIDAHAALGSPIATPYILEELQLFCKM